jgi:rare lipoprotein A
VRTRLFVAAPALIAVAALVTIADPAVTGGGAARTSDLAAFRELAFERPMPTVTTILSIDAGTTSAGDLSEDTALLEPGDPALPVERPAVRQPSVKPVAVSKSRWRSAEYSWYGAPFYGSGTACGQTYSKSILGVAHLSLPCGTRVTLRNPANGRTITVRVIDRGPYVSGRLFDLSRATCAYLRNCYTGTIAWRLP